MQIRTLLATLILCASPALLADDMLDIDSRIEIGRNLLFQINDDVSDLVRAQSNEARALAVSRLELARSRGAAGAAYQLGFIYLSGRFGVAPDLAEAERNYELAVAQELTAALLDYGLMLYHGRHFPRNVDRGWNLLNRAAELGNAPAVAYLMHLLRETTVEKDADMANAWFNSLGMRDDAFVLEIDGDPDARARDYASGQAAISVLYREGVILPKSQRHADIWFGRIDPELVMAALDDIAAFYSSSNHARSDQHLARSLQEITINSGEPTIINNYAWLLATALSEDLRDGERAVRLMEELFETVEPRAFMVDTLAAAYAEAGNFDKAIVTQDRANTLFESESLELSIGIEHRDAYVEGRPWRE